FVLSVTGVTGGTTQTTAPISYVEDALAGTDAQARFKPLAANIQAALDAVLGAGNTIVLSSPTSLDSPRTGVITIQFSGALAQSNVPTIAVALQPNGGSGAIAAASINVGTGNST